MVVEYCLCGGWLTKNGIKMKNNSKNIIMFLIVGINLAFSESSTSSSPLGELDTQSPIVSVSSPATGDIYESNTTVQLEYIITEDTNYDGISGAVFVSEIQITDYDFSLNQGETAWTSPIDNPQSVFIQLSVIDSYGNTGFGNSGVFSVGETSSTSSSPLGELDTQSPIVSVTSPNNSTTIPEYDSLNVAWTISNVTSTDSVYIYANNTSDFIFQGKVQYEADFSFVIPQGMTENALIKVIAYDIYGNTGENVSAYFSITDNTPPTVEVEVPGNTSLVIGDEFTIHWTASDNVGVETISLYYKTNGDWVSMTEDAPNVNEYDWFVPNEPTDNLQLRLIGFDAVGLSDTSKVENISIEIAYPVMVNPAFWSNIHFKSQEFIFNFSQALDSNTVTEETVQFQSSHSDLSPSISYIDSSLSIKVYFENGLVSMDTLSISFSSDISNIYGYPLDGNHDGVGGDGITVEFYTSMLGDYDGDYTISVEDVVQFITHWNNENYEQELGPFSGAIPYVSVNSDNNYNIEDMSAFALMWNWYYSNHNILFTEYEDTGLIPAYETTPDSILIELPDNLTAYQVQIQYTPGTLFITKPNGEESLLLTHDEKEVGLFTLMSEPGQYRLAIPIEIRGHNVDISVSYKGVNGDGIISGQSTHRITIENIPIEYSLYANYPNPFNPVTRIDYGLPEENHVTMIIYDIMGREIKTLVNNIQTAGYKSIIWDGTNTFGNSVSAGMYFYAIQAGDFRQVRKMVLLK